MPRRWLNAGMDESAHYFQRVRLARWSMYDGLSVHSIWKELTPRNNKPWPVCGSPSPHPDLKSRGLGQTYHLAAPRQHREPSASSWILLLYHLPFLARYF